MVHAGADVVLNGVGFATVAGDVSAQAAEMSVMKQVIQQQNNTIHAQAAQMGTQQQQLQDQTRSIAVS